ncbi:MAG: hypothetical protein GWO24_20355 [Akkermansiaceae bacterium]|nr:hypothetical protein [Akkermansiaceae bacterium]
MSAEEFGVAGLNFTPPDTFQPVKPKSAMRKAQFGVGKGDKAGEIVFFYFGAGGAGGVEANVKRWFGQFKEPLEAIAPRTEKAKAGEVPVTFVSAQGTFKSGPPRGPAVEKPGYALLGAIIEAKQGAIFVKFTGPRDTVETNTEAFKKMVTGAK